MKEQINSLLNATHVPAPEMTHDLRCLGSGDMATGIRYLWLDGFKEGTGTGIITGACAVVSAGLLYYIATKKKRLQKGVEAIDTAFKAGVESGKREAEATRNDVSVSPNTPIDQDGSGN